MSEHPSKAWARYGALGFEFVAAIAIGYVAGGWLDRRLGSDPWLRLLGGLFGIGLGFYLFMRTAKALQAQAERETGDDEQRAPEPAPEAPDPGYAEWTDDWGEGHAKPEHLRAEASAEGDPADKVKKFDVN